MKKLMERKKGQVMGQLTGLVIGLVVLGLVLTVSFLIMGEVASNSNVVADSNATAAIEDTQNAAADIPTWLSIVVITIIGALLIALVSRFTQG